jgi:hypothetical protein
MLHKNSQCVKDMFARLSADVAALEESVSRHNPAVFGVVGNKDLDAVANVKAHAPPPRRSAHRRSAHRRPLL